jgi:hypothetical protein
MSLESIREDLKSDPETVTFEIAGDERHFLLSVLGMERARKKEDVLPIIFSFVERYGQLWSDEEETPSARDIVEDNDLRDLSIVMWSGFLTFDDDLTLDEVQMIMTPARMVRVIKDVFERMVSFLNDFDQEEIARELEGSDESGN